MTTIAYRDGIMAADSQVTGNDMVRGAVDKMRRLADGGIVGVCGASGYEDAVATWLNSPNRTKRPRIDGNHKLFGIVVAPDGTVSVFSSDFHLSPVFAEFHAQGSGNELAMGAMAMGATAEEAVAVACVYDVYTGGRISTLSLAPDASPQSRTAP